ncbi:MAG: DUF5320 family protein [Desulfovibrionales bacterium]
MPGYDRTGPRGEGPMTGGGFGQCGTGRNAAGGSRGFGRGFFCRGRGRGFGLGYGRGAGPRQVEEPVNERSGWIQSTLGRIEERLAALEERLRSSSKGRE